MADGRDPLLWVNKLRDGTVKNARPRRSHLPEFRRDDRTGPFDGNRMEVNGDHS
jgi:hypothetical protein